MAEPALGASQAFKAGAFKRAKHYDSFTSYVSRLANEGMPAGKFVGVSSQAAKTVDLIVKDLVKKLATEGANLSRDAAHKKTLDATDIITATRLIFPRELGAAAIDLAVKSAVRVNVGAEARKGMRKKSKAL